MVRLVFRPYTQIRRSICTSESLRASTRVSPGFTLFGHSSPSFGSQQAHSHSNPTTSGADRSMMRGQARARSQFGATHFRFHSAQGFATRRLARMLHSLVRVSRRVGWDRLGASDLSAHRDCAATPTSHSAGNASSPHRSDAVVAAIRPCGLRCSGEGRHSHQSPARRTQGARTETRRARPPAPQGTWRTRNCR